MVRTEAQLTGQDWQNIETSSQPIILFFNEPERADMTPEHAADLWKQHMWPLRAKGKKLVSPSCANDSNGQKWINAWLELVKDHPPDFLGLHYYGEKAEPMIEFVEMMHRKHPEHKIIVSEWACTSRKYEEVLEMTVQIANWLDEQDFIFEHAIFGCMRKVADNFVSPAAQLMHPDGSFTELFMKYQDEVPMRLK